MIDTGKCSFCSHRFESINAIICGEDKKNYQDIYECSQKHLQGEIFFDDSIDWNNSEGLLSPFCPQCFQSAHNIYRTSQELEKLQSVLDGLVEKFRHEIKLKISEISKVQITVTEGFVPDENLTVTPHADFYYDEEDNADDDLQLKSTEVDYHLIETDYVSSLQSAEIEKNDVVVKEESVTDEFDDGIHETNLSGTDDESPFEFFDDQETKYRVNNDEPGAGLWPRVILERLRFDNNGHLIPPTFAEVNKLSVRKRTASITARTSLKNSKKYFDSTDSSTHDVPSVERFKSRKTFISHKVTRNEKIYQERPFSCELCEGSFPTKGKLKLHFRKVHDSEECKCNICGKVCKNEMSRKWHVNKVHRSRTKTCEECGLSFKTKCTLKSHIDVVHKKILKHKCAECGRCFGFLPNLKRHEEIHKNDSERLKFKCEICGDKYFTQKVLLTTHQKQIHTVFTNGPITCHQCHNKFPDLSTLNIHSRLTGGDRQHSCEFCKERFNSRCELYIHSAKAHPSEDQPYQCKQCLFFFNSDKAIRLHSAEQHGMKTDIFKCTLCGKGLTSKDRLAVHEKRCREVKIPNPVRKLKEIERRKRRVHLVHQCEICGKKIDSRRMKRHRDTHFGGPKETRLCTICGKDYPKTQIHSHVKHCQKPKKYNKTDPALKNVIKNLEAAKACETISLQVESEEGLQIKNIYKCTFCGKSFRCPALVKRHARVHTGEKPYSCDICEFKSADLVNVETHKKVHTGEKPFVCDICGSAFSQNANLKRHRMTHTGERHHKCPHCDKSFTAKAVLQTHIRCRHTGEKPYSCKICSKSFSDRSTWYKHEKNHK